MELLPDVETMEEKIECYAEPLRLEGLRGRDGHPQGKALSREIIAHMEEIGADLLIIGRHSKRSERSMWDSSEHGGGPASRPRDDSQYALADGGRAGEGRVS